MVSVFCLRLASGLIGALLILPVAEVNARFFRTHFLTAFGLVVAATAFLSDEASFGLWLASSTCIGLTLLGALAWSLEKSPADRVLILLSALGLTATLIQVSRTGVEMPSWLVLNEISSAALLGTATTAMLMGHSYLIAPTMTLRPLLRLLTALFVALLIRVIIAGAGVYVWSRAHSLMAIDETTLFLPVRWAVGFIVPTVLGIMAWETTKIRSTQSATGILYVVVILTFLGELTSQVLLGNDLLGPVKGGSLS